MEEWASKIRLRVSVSPLRPLTSFFYLNSRIYTLVAFTVLSTFILLDLALWDFVASFPDGTMLPIHTNCSSLSATTAPYCTLNVKSLMMDPPDFYLHDPSSTRFVAYLNLGGGRADTSWKATLLTANTISILHVLVALLSSRLITSDSLTIRRIGVLLFQLRNFLDEVDGAVGKRNDANNSETESKLGYWVDGICDGLGSSFLFLGCYFYLQKHPGRNSSALFSYDKLPVVITAKRSDSASDTSAQSWSRRLLRILNRPGFIGIFFGWQTLISTTAWNRFILLYTNLLEEVGPEEETTKAERRVKAALIRSPVMWMIILAWRYVNPHTWIEILLMAIFFDRMSELLTAFRCRGFIIVIFVTGATEAHLRYTKLINF